MKIVNAVVEWSIKNFFTFAIDPSVASVRWLSTVALPVPAMPVSAELSDFSIAK